MRVVAQLGVVSGERGHPGHPGGYWGSPARGRRPGDHGRQRAARPGCGAWSGRAGTRVQRQPAIGRAGDGAVPADQEGTHGTRIGEPPERGRGRRGHVGPTQARDPDQHHAPRRGCGSAGGSPPARSGAGARGSGGAGARGGGSRRRARTSQQGARRGHSQHGGRESQGPAHVVNRIRPADPADFMPGRSEPLFGPDQFCPDQFGPGRCDNERALAHSMRHRSAPGASELP